MRTDNAALESLAVRAYHAVRLDSSDQAAVLAPGTVGWRPEISWFVLIRATQHFVPWPTPRLGGPTQAVPKDLMSRALILLYDAEYFLRPGKHCIAAVLAYGAERPWLYDVVQ